MAQIAPWELVAIAERAAARPMADNGVVDASMCHGSAGLAHIFNRLYQATGSPVLRAAAVRWLEDVVHAWRPEAGLGGYVSHGLLTGAAGISLVLLAAATPQEPSWDRLYLLS